MLTDGTFCALAVWKQSNVLAVKQSRQGNVENRIVVVLPHSLVHHRRLTGGP